ncbi:MAG TPA: DUF4159 domain-containing protein [Acidobacteriota bacterium]|nr:DUF4159 domain-containing protein [Acidobacteriota bacterium]
MKPPRSRPPFASLVATAVVCMLTTGAMAASIGQWGRRGNTGPAPEVEYDNAEYDGRFSFARVKFNPSQWRPGRYQWGLDLKWNHDYPRGDRRLAEILDLVTGVSVNQDNGNIVGLDEPELFRYPWAYICEVGFLTLTDGEAENLRNYMLKGGFVVVDDFVGYHWYNFEDEMRKVIPGGRFVELDASHPVFHAFFDIDDLFFGGGQYYGYQGGGMPRYFGLFEDNDPDKRLMMIVNYDNDIGEYWEFAGSPYLEIDLTNDAFKLGVNYVMYSMLH